MRREASRVSFLMCPRAVGNSDNCVSLFRVVLGHVAEPLREGRQVETCLHRGPCHHCY
jgi:hypothetical protein